MRSRTWACIVAAAARSARGAPLSTSQQWLGQGTSQCFALQQEHRALAESHADLKVRHAALQVRLTALEAAMEQKPPALAGTLAAAAGPNATESSAECTISDFLPIEEHMVVHVDGLVISQSLQGEKWSNVSTRLSTMDELGISRMAISPITPGLQKMEDGFEFTPDSRRGTMRAVNEAIAKYGKESGGRLRGLCSLFMWDVHDAIEELRWCKAAGFPGVLLNGAEQIVTMQEQVPHELSLRNSSGPKDLKPTLKYDYYYKSVAFFQECARLKMFVYLHPQCLPKPPTGLYSNDQATRPSGKVDVVDAYSFNESDDIWSPAPCDAKFDLGAPWGYQVNVATIAGHLILAGVFRDVPDLRMVLGHQGEILAFMLSRIDSVMNNQLRSDLDVDKPISFTDTFKKNFYVTTSGFFDTAALVHLLSVLPHDRILFSADTPYEEMDVATEWFRGISKTNPTISCDTLQNIAYKNAEALLSWK